MSSSIILVRRFNYGLVRSPRLPGTLGGNVSKTRQRGVSTMPHNGNFWERPMAWVVAGAVLTAASFGSSHLLNTENSTTSLESMVTLPMRPTLTVDPSLMDSTAEKNNKSFVEEPTTGFSFPATFQSKHLLGLGVRKKYAFWNVYAVAFYANQEDFQGLSKEEYEENLLNPHNHRVIRIIMNRTLSMDVVIKALLEAIEPRMQGKDLHALDYFSKLRTYGTLEKGDDIQITIKGDSLELNCSNGGKSVVQGSEVFTRAALAAYFDEDAIIPEAKSSVLAGISKL